MTLGNFSVPGSGVVPNPAEGEEGYVLTVVDGIAIFAPSLAGGTVTDVTASSPLASSGGATPNISLTGVVSIARGGTNNGSLGVVATGIIAADGTKLVQIAGAALQSFRVNAGGTAIEAYTPSGGGSVTDVTASAPLASSGGATPDISLTGTVAVGNGGTGFARSAQSANRTGAVTLTSTSPEHNACDGTTAPFTVTIPTATSGINGLSFTFVKSDVSANAITIAAASGSISGMASFILDAQYKTLTCRVIEAVWYIT